MEYYELMIITRRGKGRNADICPNHEFRDMDEIDELARKIEIDSESMCVSSAIGVIRWLLKNDESVNGKYILKKKK